MYRSFASSLILAAVTSLSATAATSLPAPPVPPETSLAEPAQYGGWRGEREYSYRRHCARLRRACMFKEQRGEVGEGNCRRYRRECGRY